jgi:hypothetical protein
MSGVRIPDMPDLGAVTDATEFVADYGGSGVVRATALRDYTTAQAARNSGRNLLHNGRFNVWQRGAGPFTSNYTADRWGLAAVTDTMSATQVTATDSDRITIGDESARYTLTAAVTGDAGSGSFSYLIQPIERLRRLAGKTVTLSFWARTTAGTQRLGINALQHPGTGGSPSTPTWALATGNTVTLSTTWTRYTSVITMPSAIGKTLGTDDNSYTGLALFTSSGSGASAPLSGNIGTQSFTLQLWGLQLEIGATATPLEALDPEDDLRHCQRFFQSYTNCGMQGYMAAAASITTSDYILSTPLRGNPTVTLSNQVYTNGSALVANSFSSQRVRFSWACTALGVTSASWDMTLSADL